LGGIGQAGDRVARRKPSSTCAPAGVALIRPDGDIGWASRGGELGAHGLRAVLRRWFTPG
jgi:hypothetical protein